MVSPPQVMKLRTPKQEKVFVQKRATKSYTRSYLFQKGKSFVAYGRFQFGTNRSQNIWSKVDQKKWCDSTSWEVFQRGNVKVENSLQASYTEPIFLNFTEEFCFWNMTSSETLQGGKKTSAQKKNIPILVPFRFFGTCTFSSEISGISTSIFLDQPPTEVPGNGFGSCLSWRRVAGISQQIGVWVNWDLRESQVVVCLSVFVYLVGFLLKQISSKITIFFERKVSWKTSKKTVRCTVYRSVAGDQKVWNPNHPLLLCFLQVVLRRWRSTFTIRCSLT